MYEYKVISGTSSELEKQLNVLAREGWRPTQTLGTTPPGVILERETGPGAIGNIR